MRLILIYVLMLLPTLAFSQEEAFYIKFNNKPLSDAFSELESTYNVRFSYKDDFVRDKTLTLALKKRTLVEALEAIKEQLKLNYKILDQRYIIVSEFKDDEMYVQQLAKVIVSSYLTKGIFKTSDASYELYPSKLGILPGLTEPDVLESIQLLPGVLSPNETATGFFVRGGASDQNRLIWDGINIYHKGHLFGMITPFNPYATSKIKFINKGSHVRYGERLSSVIDVSSTSKIENKLKAAMGFNGYNGDAILEVPILKDKMSLQASFRRSYVGVLETFAFKPLAKKVFEGTKIRDVNGDDNEFSFLDYNIKLNYKPNANNTLYASIISIDNQLDYVLDNIDANRTFYDQLEISNTGYGVGWATHWNNKISQTISAYFSDYKLNYDFITSGDNIEFSNFEKRNTIYDSGIATEVTVNASKNKNYTFGYQYVLKDVAYAFLNNNGLSFVLDTEDTKVNTHSFYGSYAYQSKKLFDVTFGLRGTYFKELDAVRLEPRLLIYKPIFKNLKLQATGEFKNQIISEIDETILSDLSLENRVWRLADGNKFPIINSQQYSLGAIYSKQGFNIDVDAYYKKLKNITALSLGYLNPDNNTFNIGKQYILGLDVFAQKRFDAFDAWVSYSYNRSKSNFKDLNNSKDFTSKSNVTHSISTALSYKLNGFQLALGWRWQTGKPYTVSEEGVDGLQFNEGINTAKLPVYHRLDLSSTYNFKFSKHNQLRGKVGFSIRNIYNRKNLISREYRGNNSLNDPVERIDKFSIGIMPNVMVRLYW